MRSDFPQLAEYTSSKERMAEDAERDLTKYYHARWASEHVGESFPGIISGVTNFGIFVSLPNGVEGRIHVSQLDDDYYMYLEDSMMLLGKHTRKTFKLGEKLEIKILASQAVQRQIDLIPAYMEVPEPESEEETEYEAPPKQLRTPLRKERKEPEKAEVSLKAKAEPKEKTPKQEDKPEPAQTKKRRKVLIFGDPNKWK